MRESSPGGSYGTASHGRAVQPMAFPYEVRRSGRFNAGSSFGRSEGGGHPGVVDADTGCIPGGGLFPGPANDDGAPRARSGRCWALVAPTRCLYRRRVLNGFLPQDGRHPTGLRIASRLRNVQYPTDTH
jgi:hypothetical protein